mmetsp:Transcript_7714/g.25569  ORF Transcript_7714/g.25569 Transcript_7714/m.25569 type:complete len:212 (-) Transcript_7714:109-744(-)
MSPLAHEARTGTNHEAGAETDYDKEGTLLLERLGITVGASSGRYHLLDCIYQSADGGRVYVGSQGAATSISLLREYNITHVVNCTDAMPLFHEGVPGLHYYRFDVARWRWNTDSSEASLRRFLQPMIGFVEGALAEKTNVLVHCLAGAHRAGTTGTMLIMHLSGKASGENLSVGEAVSLAKRCRPIIDPIGSFTQLLQRAHGVLGAKWAER